MNRYLLFVVGLVTAGLVVSVRPGAGQAPTDTCFQMSDSCSAGLNCLPIGGLLSPDYTHQVATGFQPDPIAPQCGRNRLTKVACGDLQSSPCDDGSGGAGGGGGGGGGGCDRGAGGVCPAQCFTCGQAFGAIRKLPPEVLARLQAASLPQSVGNLLAAFAKIQTAHLRAAVVVNDMDLHLPKELQRTRSVYEYWGKGGLFRIHSPLDPRLALSYVTDVAFNGEVWQVVAQGKSSINTLTLDGSDHPSAPTFIDNPLFLPLSFLSPADSELCPLCELRLSDMGALQANHASAASVSSVGSSSTTTTFEIAGGRGYKQNVQFQVYRDEAGRTTQITRTEGGKTLDSLTLSDYQPVSGATFEFPRRLTLVQNNESSAPWLTLDFIVDTVEINTPIDDGTFVIPATTVDRIWDGDQKIWLKTDLALRPCKHLKPAGS